MELWHVGDGTRDRIGDYVTAKKTSALLTLDQIAAIDDRQVVDVEVEEWGGTVQIRPLTLQQINQCTKRAQDEKRGNEVNPEVRNGWYLVEGMVSPKITIDVAEVWLTERSAGPVSEVLGAILTSSGLTERAKDAAKSRAEDRPDPEVPVRPVA